MTLEVRVRNNNVEKAMRQLKKKVKEAGILHEVQQRQFYEKPSLKRQRLKKESIKRVNKLRRLQERLDNN